MDSYLAWMKSAYWITVDVPSGDLGAGGLYA